MKNIRIVSLKGRVFWAIAALGLVIGIVLGIIAGVASRAHAQLQEPAEEPLVQTGTIRICALFVDENNVPVDPATLTGLTFTTPNLMVNTAEGNPADNIGNFIVTSPITYNTHLVYTSTGDDAFCTTYNNLTPGNYYYGREIITDAESNDVSGQWNAPLYHDEVEDYLYTFDWLRPYSAELFDESLGNIDTREYSSDGLIALYDATPVRTLVIVNQKTAATLPVVVTPPAGGHSRHRSVHTIITDTTTDSNNSSNTTTDTASDSTNNTDANEDVATPEGKVLGEAMCGEYLHTSLRYGYDNDPEEVKKLQTFLNTFLPATLEVNGIFTKETDNAVRAFQQKYAEQILKPWKMKKASGIVHTTTRIVINNLACKTLNIPAPTKLLTWKVDPLTAHIKKHK